MGCAASMPANSGTIKIHAARYGWAGSIWRSGQCSYANGCKDVIAIVRRDVQNNELHINTNCKAQYMNQHFWPETASGPPIPRKLSVRYSYGSGPVREATTRAVPHETVRLDVTPSTNHPKSKHQHDVLSGPRTPSHGSPASSSPLNTELNNVARNTNDCDKARRLVASGADLSSTNGPSWRHTPLHQAAYHGRFEMAKTLIELGAPLTLHSNACGRGKHGTPLELARGGGHHQIASLIEDALNADVPVATRGAPPSFEPEFKFSAGRKFQFSGKVGRDKFDKNGVLFALGNGRNPYESGAVKMRWSHDAANYYSKTTGHQQNEVTKSASIICANRHWGSNATQWSRGAPGAWFLIELPQRLRLAHYVYRGDYGGGGNHPRSWDLQGSNDGQSWATLRSHRKDSSVTSKKCGSWPVKTSQAFTHFKIQNTGTPKHLCCSGIELYGSFEGSETAAAAPSAPLKDQELGPPPAFDDADHSDFEQKSWGQADTIKTAGMNVD